MGVSGMKLRMFLVTMAFMVLLPAQVNAGRLIYHPEYPLKEVGPFIIGLLNISDIFFNNGRSVFARLGKEDLFITNAPRAYVDLFRAERVKLLLDVYLEDFEDVYYITHLTQKIQI